MSGQSNDGHCMNRVSMTPDGWEEFYCPICSRRIRLRWPPEFAREVLNEGDTTQEHRYDTDPEEWRLEVYEPVIRKLDDDTPTS